MTQKPPSQTGCDRCEGAASGPADAAADAADGEAQGSSLGSGRGARSAKRRQDSRQRLLAAARDLFVDRGYHNTRPQDVAKAAQLGHGTFYLHFPDKRACFFAFVDEASGEVDTMIKARLQGQERLEDRVTTVIETVIDYNRANPGVLAAALSDPGIIDRTTDQSDMLMARWARFWAEDLASFADTGKVWTDYDWEVVGFAIMGMMHQTSKAIARDDEGRRRMGKTLSQFVIRALTVR